MFSNVRFNDVVRDDVGYANGNTDDHTIQNEIHSLLLLFDLNRFYS